MVFLEIVIMDNTALILGIFLTFAGIVFLYTKKINLILGTLTILLGITALAIAFKSYVLN